MIPELKENITHGTKEYPYEQYNIRNPERAFQVPVHWHDEMEIIMIERGELDIRIGNQDYIGEVGEVFFVNPRELHLMESLKIDGLYYTMLFPLEFISFQTIDALESELLAPIRNNQLLFPHKLEPALEEKIKPFLREIVTANIKMHELEADEISLARNHLNTRIQLLQILQCMYEEGTFIKAEQGNHSNMQKEMLAYIQECYLDKITLAMLADQFHLSEKYVSRFFVTHFHMPFSNYVVHLRLTHARQLLETTDEPITEIAMKSGFSNVSYFIRSFKAMYGMAPLQYRKGGFVRESQL